MVELTSMFEKNPNTNMYFCKSCEYQPNHKNHMKGHVLYKHTASSNLECENCKKLYKNVLTYNKHTCTKNGTTNKYKFYWECTNIFFKGFLLDTLPTKNVLMQKFITKFWSEKHIFTKKCWGIFEISFIVHLHYQSRY